ncbi:MAG: hypothetical protein ACREL7_13900 [Longimicrobiales bacterium]
MADSSVDSRILFASRRVIAAQFHCRNRSTAGANVKRSRYRGAHGFGNARTVLCLHGARRFDYDGTRGPVIVDPGCADFPLGLPDGEIGAEQ